MYSTFDERDLVGRMGKGPRAMVEHVALVDRRFYKTIKFAPQGPTRFLSFFLSFLSRFVYHTRRDFARRGAAISPSDISETFLIPET